MDAEGDKNFRGTVITMFKYYWDVEGMHGSREMTKTLCALYELIDSLDELNDNPSSENNVNEGNSCDSDNA